MMPEQDGLSVCRALRAGRAIRGWPRFRSSSSPAAPTRQDTAAGFTAGVTDYLTKPFKPTHLVARLQAWLLRPRPPLC